MAPQAYSYIRFSTPQQKKGDSVRRQLEDSRKWADEHGFVLDENLRMRDEGLSAYHGNHLERGALGQFLRLIEAGRIPQGSVLIVENFDRLSREKVLDALALFTSIIRAGIKVVTTQDNKEYTVESVNANPMDLMVSILIMMRAHEESDTKSDRGKKKWIAKRQEAAEGGRKLTARTHGWLKLSDDRNRYEPIPERVEVIKRMFLERLEGKSPPRITRELNEDKTIPWRPISLRHKKECGFWAGFVEETLKSRAVLGEFQPHKMVKDENGKQRRVPEGHAIPNYFPAIIDEDLFYQVQATFQQNLQPRRNGNGVTGMGGRNGNMNNLFAFIAKCGYCGDGMQLKEQTVLANGFKRHYLLCARARRKAGCQIHYVPYDVIEFAVLTYCRGLEPADLLPDRDEAESRLRTLQGKLSSTETRISVLARKEATLLDEIEDTLDREERRLLRPRLQAVREEKTTLEQDLVGIRREIVTASSASQTLQEHLDGLKQLFDVMESIEGQARIELRLRLRNEIRRIIERVEVYPLGSAYIPGISSSDDLEIHIHFHSGRFMYLYPGHPGSLTIEFPEDYEGEY